MDELFIRTRSIAAVLAPFLASTRRHLHANPELSFEEHETMEYICNILSQWGIAYRDKVAGTGIVVDLVGSGPGPVIALRADMDALPIQELNEVDYRSKVDGRMHACGHDVHSTCLLGSLKILHDLRAEWGGTVRCIFQPGEELLPGGASLMIKDGVLENPRVDAIIGQHVFPDLPSGQVGFRAGMYMASTDEIYLMVKGKGGHGAMPHLNIDPVITAAQILISLQEIVSRKARPNTPSVLSFGKVQADGATNVIPDTVLMAGTFRTMDEAWREEAHRLIQHIAESTAQARGATCEVDIRRGYPFLVNNPDLTQSCRKSAETLLGTDKVQDLPLRMTAEDFAYYSQVVPACFYRLGTASANGSDFRHSVHNPRFDIDESALVIGASTMAALALGQLSKVD